MIGRMVLSACALALLCTPALARPKHARIDSQPLTYCEKDQTYRHVCQGLEQRPQRHQTAFAGHPLPCRRVLDCGCSLAKFFHIQDKAKARRLWVAKRWLKEFPHASGPMPGAVAVLSRRGGGHVGLVKGVDPNGNPIVESFKYYGPIGQAVYPKSRVLGYVWASR